MPSATASAGTGHGPDVAFLLEDGLDVAEPHLPGRRFWMTRPDFRGLANDFPKKQL
jgi:hypothetical protein